MLLYASDIANFREAAEGRYLIDFMVSRYEKISRRDIRPERRLQWKYNIRNLCALIDSMRANPECGIRIDLCTSSLQQRLVTIFASKDTDDAERVVVLDMPGWEDVRLSEVEDMVICDEADGLGEKEAIHPSYQALAYKYYLTKGNDIPGIEFIPVTYLFECTKRPECDIVSRYRPEILEKSPVFYACEEKALRKLLKPVLSAGNGTHELYKLQQLGKAIMNANANTLFDEQKLIINAVKATITAGADAWYLIESSNGSGKSVISRIAQLDASRCGSKLTIIDNDDFTPDALPVGGCVLCFHRPNTNAALLDKAKENAAEKGILLQTFSLNEKVGIADNGNGLNFLSRYLQLSSENKYWDSEAYLIEIVDSAEALPQKHNYSSVVIPKAISYDPETGKVCGSVDQRQKVINHVAEGTLGTYIFPEDEALREYLHRKVTGAQRKYDWLKTYSQDLNNDSDRLHEAQSVLLANSKLRDKYANSIKDRLGEENWNKLTEESKTWLISGMLAYSDMEDFDQLLDFSGVCVQLCKAIENEMGLRHMTNYIKYEEEKYGDQLFRKIPYELLLKDKYGHRKRVVRDPSRYTLGDSKFIIGLDPDGNVFNDYSWRDFEEYSKNCLLKDPSRARETMARHIGFIIDIKDRFRNQAAHSNHMDIAQAKECIECILGSYNRLGSILDDYIC